MLDYFTKNISNKIVNDLDSKLRIPIGCSFLTSALLTLLTKYFLTNSVDGDNGLLSLQLVKYQFTNNIESISVFFIINGILY